MARPANTCHVLCLRACFVPARLSNSQGNLLDDTELIDVLAVTKQTAQDVSDKLANASETNKKINEACEEYRPVAHRATLIYFLIAEFAVVNCMYQTSLAQFNELYEHSIDNSEKASLPSKRIANIIEQMTYDIYLYIQVRCLIWAGPWTAAAGDYTEVLQTSYSQPGPATCHKPSRATAKLTIHLTFELSGDCIAAALLCFCVLQRGLFERHKLLFALMLTNKILVSAGKVKPQDVDILLKGGGALDITSVSVGACSASDVLQMH